MAVNNSWLIEAVRLLKANGTIKKDFELVDLLGFSQPVISSYLNNRVSASKNFISKFKLKYPEIFEISNKDISKDNLTSITKEGDENHITKYSDNQLNTSTVGEIDISNLMYVPFINQYAYAGYLSGYGDVEFMEELPKIPFIVDKEYHGNYVCFEVRGDSMDVDKKESYCEGDIVLCREIQRHHWKDKLHINKWTFVVVHDESIVIKKIKQHNVEKGTITLHSLNTLYEDFTISLDEVKQLFNVVKTLRKDQ